MKKNNNQVNASALPREIFQRTAGVRRSLMVTSVLTVLSFAGPSFAYPEYPNAVREAASMSCTPSCTLCHTVDPGVSGTASQPFATVMMDADPGVLLGKPEAIAPAYAALMADLDSD